MRKIFITSLLFYSLLQSRDFSFEITEYSKFGFNNQRVDLASGKYPTDSFGSLYSAINYDKKFNNNLVLGASFAFGGLIFDSTRSDPNTKGGLAYKYIGYYSGFLGNIRASASNTQNYFIKDLYIGYVGEKFSIKAGRFLLKNTLWLTGRNSAIEMHYKQGITNNYLVIGEKKSSYGGKWLKFYRFTNGTKVPTIILGSKITPQNFVIHPFLQFQATRYFAPSLHFNYHKNISESFGINTNFYALFVIHTKEGKQRNSSYDIGEAFFGPINKRDPYLYGYGGRKVGNGGLTLALKQDFNLKSERFGEHHLGFILYGNIGNPNAFVGNYGNPIGIDVKDNTVYDRGTANNGFFDSNSFSAILFWNKKVQNYTIKLLNRVTISPRVFEESFSFSVSYPVAKGLAIGVNLTIFEVKTSKGFRIYKTYLQNSRWDDRSFLSTYITYRY